MIRQSFALVLLNVFMSLVQCHAVSREEALKPQLDRVWSLWKKLPADYQERKEQTLEDYLSLFTTTNGFTWNRQCTAFLNSMGPEFVPLRADLIEAMKVAEAYEAGFPNPEERLPGVADVIFERVPNSALLFV